MLDWVGRLWFVVYFASVTNEAQKMVDWFDEMC